MSRSYCQPVFSPEHFSKVLQTLQNEQEPRRMFSPCQRGLQSAMCDGICRYTNGWTIHPMDVPLLHRLNPTCRLVNCAMFDLYFSLSPLDHLSLGALNLMLGEYFEMFCRQHQPIHTIQARCMWHAGWGSRTPATS